MEMKTLIWLTDVCIYGLAPAVMSTLVGLLISKLLGWLDWPWLWLLSPLWLWWALLAVLFGIIFVATNRNGGGKTGDDQ